MGASGLALDFHPQMPLVVATVLGALVGHERERVGKPAGVLRTHGMVSLGAIQPATSG